MHSLEGNPLEERVLEGYAGRFAIEPTFSDLKSRGFDLEKMRMTAPKRLETLLLVLVLVLLWYQLSGSDLELSGGLVLPPRKAPRAKRLRSWFTVGCRAWRSLLMYAQPDRLRRFLSQWVECLITGQRRPLVSVT